MTDPPRQALISRAGRIAIDAEIGEDLREQLVDLPAARPLFRWGSLGSDAPSSEQQEGVCADRRKAEPDVERSLTGGCDETCGRGHDRRRGRPYCGKALRPGCPSRFARAHALRFWSPSLGTPRSYFPTPGAMTVEEAADEPVAWHAPQLLPHAHRPRPPSVLKNLAVPGQATPTPGQEETPPQPREGTSLIDVSAGVPATTGATIGPRSTPFAACAASSCSKPLLDAALADELLGIALRALAEASDAHEGRL